MKTKKRHLLPALIIILLLPLLALPAFPVYAADWYDADWSTRVPITINNAGSALTDYQVEIDVAYDTEMQSNFNDLRFTGSDGVTELNYWIMEKEDGVSARVWVKVPTIAGYGDTVIYMYYGNPAAASASDGDATFIFFENFGDDASLDTSKWTTLVDDSSNPTLTVDWSSSEYVEIDADTRNYAYTNNHACYGIKTSNGYAPCFIAELKHEVVSYTRSATLDTQCLTESDTSAALLVHWGYYAGASPSLCRDGEPQSPFPILKWFRMSLHTDGSGTPEWITESRDSITNPWTSWSSGDYTNTFTHLYPRLYQGVTAGFPGQMTGRWYYYFVHECPNEEPTYQFGDIESQSGDEDAVPVIIEEEPDIDGATVGIDVYTVSKAGLLLPWTGLLILMMGVIIITVRRWNRL